MDRPNGASPDLSTFDALAAHVEQLHEVAARRRDLLKNELAEADREAKRLERMLLIARPELQESRPKPTNPGRKRQPASRVSPAMLERIMEYMEAHDPAPLRGFVMRDIAEELGVSESSISYGLQELRQQERVRLLGRAPRQEGSTGMPPNIYAVMPSG